METLVGLSVGIGLSAACGFRVFVPLLLASLAAHTGHLNLSQDFVWMGSTTALLALSAATLLEIIAYYVPWLDNALDSIATPAAVTAGTLMTASLITELDPFLRWSLAIIAGGGVAGTIQGSTVFSRSISSTTTGGLANPLLSTAELGSSLLTALLAILLPLLTATLALLLLAWIAWRVWKNYRLKKATPSS
ncbi:MAG: hypothetical protein RI897_1647 [Verrucomicrobiota bacterium]|jgi:hypothetical protein